MSREQDSVDISEILNVKEVMDINCFIIGKVNIDSPVLVARVAIKAIRVYYGRGQMTIVAPFILSGAMGSVSIAASVTKAIAEAMMCCAYAQLIKDGLPFVLGNFLL